MTSVDPPAGFPPEAWTKGRADALKQHVPTVGADHHVLACSAGPPWLEPKWPPRKDPRRVTLHGGPYDGCILDVLPLGQVLTVGGEHGPAVYEHKEHDAVSAAYTAVEDTPDAIPDIRDDWEAGRTGRPVLRKRR